MIFLLEYALEPLNSKLVNPRRACAARVTVIVLSVCVCVCVCVFFCLSTQHLTFPTLIRVTNDITYFTVDEDQKLCAVFSENSPLQR